MNLEKITKRTASATMIGVILSILIFSGLNSAFKTYKSTVTIVIIPKSITAIAQRENIVHNLAQIPQTLSFYERLLSDNHDLKDTTANQSAQRRKEIWNNIISIKQINKDSTILKITLEASGSKDSEILASKTARTFLDTASGYYNVKSDLDLRIIDGPISQRSYDFWPILLLLSVILGFLIAYIGNGFHIAIINLTDHKDTFKRGLDKISEKTVAMFDGKKTHQEEFLIQENENSAEEQNLEMENFKESLAKKVPELEQTPEIYSEDKIKSQHDKELEALNKIIQQDIYPNFPEMPTTGNVKASAPDNLPIGDDLMFAQNVISQDPQASIVQQDAPVVEEKKGEPTSEQLKQRLNQLLRGEL